SAFQDAWESARAGCARRRRGGHARIPSLRARRGAEGFRLQRGERRLPRLRFRCRSYGDVASFGVDEDAGLEFGRAGPGIERLIAVAGLEREVAMQDAEARIRGIEGGGLAGEGEVAEVFAVGGRRHERALNQGQGASGLMREQPGGGGVLEHNGGIRGEAKGEAVEKAG